jgi:hypothetical protein
MKLRQPRNEDPFGLGKRNTDLRSASYTQVDCNNYCKRQNCLLAAFDSIAALAILRIVLDLQNIATATKTHLTLSGC